MTRQQELVEYWTTKQATNQEICSDILRITFIVVDPKEDSPLREIPERDIERLYHYLILGNLTKAKSPSEASVKELEALLDYKRSQPPKPLKEPNLSVLRDMVVDAIENSPTKNGLPKHFEHYLYETAMIAVYGPDIFDWINKRGW